MEKTDVHWLRSWASVASAVTEAPATTTTRRKKKKKGKEKIGGKVK